MPTSLFWALWLVDLLVALVFIYYFFTGILDGTVGARNILVWLGVLVLIAAILGGSILLRRYHFEIMAFVPVIAMAVPSLGFGFTIGLSILMHERMN